MSGSKTAACDRPASSRRQLSSWIARTLQPQQGLKLDLAAAEAAANPTVFRLRREVAKGAPAVNAGKSMALHAIHSALPIKSSCRNPIAAFDFDVGLGATPGAMLWPSTQNQS